MKWEKLAQSPLKILEKNNAQTPKFIGLEKLAVGVCQNCRSTARSTGQRSYFRPLCHRSTDRSTEARIQRASLCSVGRPVDRGLSREQSFLDGRPGRSTGPPARTGVHVCARRPTARSTAFRLRSTSRSTG